MDVIDAMDIIEDGDIQETNMNILDENMNIIPNNNNNNNRYINILNLMGLNHNINYPINIVIDGIIQMHMDNITNIYYSFSNNKISQKIKNELFGVENTNNKFTIYTVKNMIKRAYSNHRYTYNNPNTIPIGDKQKHKIDTLGFNYNNPRWLPLVSQEIE